MEEKDQIVCNDEKGGLFGKSSSADTFVSYGEPNVQFKDKASYQIAKDDMAKEKISRNCNDEANEPVLTKTNPEIAVAEGQGSIQKQRTPTYCTAVNDFEPSKATNSDTTTSKDKGNNLEPEIQNISVGVKDTAAPSVICSDGTVINDQGDVKVDENAGSTKTLDKISMDEEIRMASNDSKDSQIVKQQKEDIAKRVENIAREVASSAWAYIIGSSKNGFGIASSDLDLTVLIGHSSKFEVLHHLHKQTRANAKCYTNISVITNAVVPIISFVDRESGISCDVSIENLNGIYNTVLLKAYAELDDRVRPLMIAIKKWAKSADILGAKYHKLASFVLYMMVLHYLQAEPKIIPSIQKMCPSFFGKKPEELAEFLDKPLPYHVLSNCRMTYTGFTLSQLFKDFFRYYNSFSWDVTGICVKEGKRKYRPRKRKLMRTCLYVEDPAPSLEQENAARSVYQSWVWKDITDRFKTAYEMLSQGKTYKDLLAVYGVTI